MVKKLLIFIAVIFLFPNRVKGQSGSPEPYYVNYEITNKKLKKEILSYMDDVTRYNNIDKAIFIVVHITPKNTKYYISYGFSPYGGGNPLHQIAQIKNTLVIFTIFGFNGGILKEHVVIQIAKNHFRRKYEYYMKNDRWPIPTTYDFVPTLVLTFKNDKLIKKEKVYY